jgi:ABC-type nitrate/sulfonate/bicarbonate transport system permease component
VAPAALRLATALAPIIGLFVLWELVGRLELIGRGSIPAPTQVIDQLWRDRASYPPHLRATLRVTGLGFLYGNLVAVVLAVAFSAAPLLERGSRATVLTLFSVPLVVVAPVIGVCFPGDKAKIIMAALVVYYPTLESMLHGLRGSPPVYDDLITTAGGGRWQRLRRVHLPGSLPSLAAGLRVAAPGALLGAMLGDFLGGRWGLGVFMLGSLKSAQPARLWGVGMVATAVALTGYGLFALIGRMLTTSTLSATVSGALPGAPAGQRQRLTAPVWAAISIAVALGAWASFEWLLKLSPIFAKRPTDIWHFLLTTPEAAEHRHLLIHGLSESLPPALVGIATGMAIALALAVTASIRPGLARALFPLALLSQTMPLVAFTPVIVLVLGRGTTAVLMVAASVIFFPCFAVISQGIAEAPPAAHDLVSAFGGGALTKLIKVSLPAALPHLFTALRLATPRALLGVILAEYLATGKGLGGLLAAARGTLDFGMLWSVAIVVAVLSATAYNGVAAAERATLRRWAGRTG